MHYHMNMPKTYIYNAQIVMPKEVVFGTLIIENDRIKEIVQGEFVKSHVEDAVVLIDAQNGYLLPGLVDMHSDAIEKEIQPRPNSLIPVKMAYNELEKKLAACGITTMYHSLCLSDDWGVRDSETVVGIIDTIIRKRKIKSMINHKIHLRYEITYADGLEILENLLNSGKIDFLSYMDHTPGQGQFKNPEDLKAFTMKNYGRQEQETQQFIEKCMELQANIDKTKLKEIAKLAKEKHVALASHDDDTKEKVDELIDFDGVLSEFPINMETAKYATEKGLFVCVGAPNVVRGKSHSNNMRAIDAITNEAANIVCSDYLPFSMLSALFQLVNVHQLSLSKASNMFSLNPAEAVGISEETGSLEVGKKADVLLVRLEDDYPILEKTFVSGLCVYRSDYRRS